MTDQHIVKQIYLLNKNDDPVFIIQEKSNWMGEFFQPVDMGIPHIPYSKRSSEFLLL